MQLTENSSAIEAAALIARKGAGFGVSLLVEVVSPGIAHILEGIPEASLLRDRLRFLALLDGSDAVLRLHLLVLVPQKGFAELLGDASTLAGPHSLTESNLTLDALSHSLLPFLGNRPKELNQSGLLGRICFRVFRVIVRDRFVEYPCESSRVSSAYADATAFYLGEGWHWHVSRGDFTSYAGDGATSRTST